MHLLLETITVLPIHAEGGAPCWTCTKPTEQYAVGVWTWRRINGSWIEGLYLRAGDYGPRDVTRTRLVVDGWAGMPRQITFYDAIGEINEADDLADRLAQTELLMGAMKQLGERG